MAPIGLVKKIMRLIPHSVVQSVCICVHSSLPSYQNLNSKYLATARVVVSGGRAKDPNGKRLKN